MLLNRLLYIVVLLFALPPVALAQDYTFTRYEVEAGLSNNAVICSVQDSMGFMWFGTRDGLNRFDGNSFKVYRFSENKHESSGNNFVHALHIDANGTLLAGTEKELYRYDAQADSFVFLLSSKYYPFDEMVTDRKGDVWFVAGNVLSKYDQIKGELKVFEPRQYFGATSVTIDQTGAVWISTTDGRLLAYNDAADSYLAYDLYAKTPAHRTRWIDKIESAGNGKILVGTNKGGFKIFDTETRTYKDVPLCCDKLENLFIRAFLQVSTEEVWLGTETGIYIYNYSTGASRKLQKTNHDQYALSDNVIYTFCKDKEGGIWVGTYFGGINYHPKQFTPFQKYYNKPQQNSLSGNVVREIKKDRFGNLWIGTEDGGLNKLDTRTGNYVHYKPDGSAQSISYICIHNLMPHGDKLWVGTYEHGLDILDIKTGKVVRHYEAGGKSGLKSNFPFCFAQTKSGEILVGTTVGIYSYNDKKDLFEPLPLLPQYAWYTCILEDEDGTIWTGISGKGVYYANYKAGETGSYSFDAADETSIASNKINSIFKDSKGQLWFATENGLCKWNSTTKNFTRYGTANGFPSNFMLAVLEDEKGRLWVSTTKGLACFNPADGNTLVYTTSNGLLSDQFNFSSAYKDETNRIYFGSAKGLVSFQPNEFTQSSYNPPIYLTGLQINNADVPIAAKGSPLTKSITFTDEITLTHQQSTFSIDFAVLSYTAPRSATFAYNLEGLSENWTYLQNNRKIYFTDLPAGTYTLKIKTTNSSGIWQPEQTQLIIHVLPPWWKSWWAYLAYAVLGLLLGIYLLRSYHLRVAEKNRKHVAELKAAKEQEIMEAKIEFFTKVAHEIRTPLTLIKIPLAKVLKKLDGTPDVEKSLNMINRNTDRLIELANQLLDFRELEIDNYQLSFSQVNISEQLNEAALAYVPMAEQKGIRYSIILPEKPVFAQVDTEAFNKIVYNLIGNALKYAESCASVTLKVDESNSTFTIQVSNDGYLIPHQYREKIFEPFFRIPETKSKKGTGIGLSIAHSLTELHKGTLHLDDQNETMNVFILTIPLQQQTTFPVSKEFAQPQQPTIA